MIQVTVNGQAHRFERPLDLSALLGELKLAQKKIAVERNGEIVPKSVHARTLLADGDRLEIVVAGAGARPQRKMSDPLVIAGKPFASSP